ncbi:Chromate resistance protein ChrB [Pseudonocardia saturnea]
MPDVSQTADWVLLCYRVPREPSTPRIAVWRTLKRFGVAQVGDGVVALPADARTREQLEWVADDVERAGGTAVLWIARPGSADQERRLAAEMAAARAQEYRAVQEQATRALVGESVHAGGVLRRLRAEMRRIERRDHFPPAERDRARGALLELAALVTEGQQV